MVALPLILMQRDLASADPAALATAYGAKALGLSRMPAQWTPPFFVIGSALFQRWLTSKRTRAGDLITSDEARQVELALRAIVQDDKPRVIVRSSAAGEDLASRGRYRSLTCEGQVEQLLASVEEVYGSASEAFPMAVIVQRALPASASGHLSNERRLRRNPSCWVREYVVGRRGSQTYALGLSSRGSRPPREDAPIGCSDSRSIDSALRSLAAWTGQLGLRMHYEWIWDGSHLWVVQADQEPVAPGSAPMAASCSFGSGGPAPELSCFVQERMVDAGAWRKLDCVKVFRDCGLATTDLWVLQDQSLIRELARGDPSEALLCDVRSLFRKPAIIRMDRRGVDEYGAMMLPRSETLSGADDAMGFLIRCSQSALTYMERGEVCFIVHRFIPSRASAFCLAQPGRRRVRIDALWGLAEGLQYYPHDSYELDSSGAGDVVRHIRYKEDFLDVDESGQWLLRRAAPPWDWRSSATSEELTAMARGTMAVCEHEGHAVQLMWFIGVPQGLGHPPSLPWYYTKQDPPERVFPSSRAALSGHTNLLIEGPDDVSRLGASPTSRASAECITLRPNRHDLLRSTDFIDSVAALALKLGVPVELRGSVLSHAYYLLRRKGVQIACLDPLMAEMPPRVFGKLVRDRIPVRIESHGEKAVVVRMSGEELDQALRSKAVEEALELYAAEGTVATQEELADLMEVVKAVSRYSGIDFHAIEEAADKKREDRGGFEAGYRLKETRELPLIGVGSLAPDLFDRDGSPVPPRRKRRSRQARPEWTPVVGESGMTLPLIPPRSHTRSRSYAMKLDDEEIRVSIRYTEKEIIIDLETADAVAHCPGQLQLDLEFA